MEQIRPISHNDRFALGELDALLRREGIRRDRNLDYSCGLYDEEEELIATGSCFGNTIRCLAVDSRRRGEGLLVRIVSHLLQFQARRGNLQVFLYTKPENLPFFEDLGFFEVARTDQAVFLENRRGGLDAHLASLDRGFGGKTAAIVMNANPFTLGHRHLVEQAARENDTVHLFLLSESFGPIPAAVRRHLAAEAIRDLPNVLLQPTGPYLISAATFPSYFLKDTDAVIRGHAAMDLAVFGKIAEKLGITTRYAGREPASRVTALYNEAMETLLPRYGVTLRVIPRLEAAGSPISAGAVRQAIHDGRWEDLRSLVPESTYRYFTSAEAEPVIRALRREETLLHY